MLDVTEQVRCQECAHVYDYDKYRVADRYALDESDRGFLFACPKCGSIEITEERATVRKNTDRK